MVRSVLGCDPRMGTYTRTPDVTFCQLQLEGFRTMRNGFQRALALLHEARHDLRMETVGPVSVPLAHGQVFDYFDEVRKVIEMAKQDLLFVDPYLDAEFVPLLSHSHPE